MDIRSFFGKSKGGGGGSSAKPKTKKSPHAPSSSTTTNNEKEKRKSAVATTMEKIAANQHSSSSSDDDDTEMLEKFRSTQQKKSKENNKTSPSPSPKKRKDPPPPSSDSEVEEVVAKKKSPMKKIVIDSSSDDDDNGKDDDEFDPDEYIEQARKRRAEAMNGGGGGGTSTKHNKAKNKDIGNSKKVGKKKGSSSNGGRKKVMHDSDSEDDELMKDDNYNNNEDDDSDDDFQPMTNKDDNEEEDVVDADYSDSEDEDIKQQPKKRKKKGTTAEPTATTSKKKASPKKKAKKEATTNQSSSDGPPKYHPPSSQITTVIPYLATSTSKIQLSHSTKSELPKLPNSNPNFSIDEMTPHCLEGINFVLSGVLSTNDAVTSQTNTALSIASPSKSEYYVNRSLDCSIENCELSRDAATDIIKCLGGKVTGSVSGKTNYLIGGNILEDGRTLEEGSKYKKCMELWNVWKEKFRKVYTGEESSDDDSDDDEESKKKKKKAKSKKKPTAAALRAQDPNTLVEVIRGIYEFYGLIVYLSDWKKGTLSDEERMELEARQQQQQQKNGMNDNNESTVSVKKEASASVAVPPAAVSNPSATNKPVPINPYAAKKPPANPYAKAAPANPYAKSSTVSNPYAKAASNPYASSSSAVKSEPALAASGGGKKPNHHPGSGKELRENSLWADKYAPSSSREILGNADSVNKLNKWLMTWEKNFNNPNKKVKALTGPNGPFKAALLSGPPGIGKTTTATLIARESGRDVIELNASDARSKKALGNVLGDVTGSQVLSFDNMGKNKNKKKLAPIQKRCIIMDEVDGMGAGDRSGMSELIQMIKKSKVPIICICNDRSSQKMKSLVGYCLDLRYRRPTKSVIARRAVQIGKLEGMNVEVNAAEAMAESCGNDIRQVLNSLQMWSCNRKTSSNGGSGGTNMTYRDLKERQSEINKDEVLRVSMFDACRSIVEGTRGLAGCDAKAANDSFYKRTDAYFVDYMLMGLMVHQNYLKVCAGQFNSAKLKDDEDAQVEALKQMSEATDSMSDFGMCEDNLRGGDQNWALLPLCSVLAVKVGHHAGGPTGGMLPGYPEFAGWLGKNSSRNKKIRLLQELRRHMNYKVSADAPELRMNYLPIMRKQFEELLFNKEGAMVTEAIELMDEYGLDRDDVFENFDEFLFNSKELKVKKFGDLDSKSKAAFTRAYNAMAHKAQALVAEQGAGKTGRKKSSGGGDEGLGVELDVVDDDKAAAEDSDNGDEDDDIEALKKKFLKKGKGKAKASGKAKAKKKK